MPLLTANTPRDFQVGEREDYPVAASSVIYEGSAVGENASGYARALVALDKFLGFAVFAADNSAGAAGAIRVEVRKKGNVRLAVVGSAITSNDRPAVYASDDGTFTLTSTGNSQIGYVSRWISGTDCIVEFDARGI